MTPLRTAVASVGRFQRPRLARFIQSPFSVAVMWLVGATLVALLAGALNVFAGPSPYFDDAFGFGGTSAFTVGLTPRWSGDEEDALEQSGLLASAAAILEHALPSAVDLNTDAGPATTYTGFDFAWEPCGLRETEMPPNPRGAHLYEADFLLDRYLSAHDPVVRIAFTSPQVVTNLQLTCPGPNVRTYLYRIDAASAAAIVNVFFVYAATSP